MAEVINMPRLSDTMEEGTVATWLKKVGDRVEEGDILAEIETDKATMEFESFNEGTLLHIGIQEGETAKVDALLAIIGDEGEDISVLLSSSNSQVTNPKDEATIIPSQVQESQSADTTESTQAEIPEDVIVVTMPRLSDTMEEGTVATWLKQIGDEVEEGDILAEIETDKATMEFESFQSGTLLHIGINEGESAKVDALLAIIGPAGTDVSAIASNFTIGENTTETKSTDSKEDVSNKNDISETDTSSSSSTSTSISSSRVFASPLAKKIAAEKGINLSDVKGSGENGRIIKRDIENYTPKSVSSTTSIEAKTAAPTTPEKPLPIVPVGEEFSEDVLNSNMRKAIAKNLAKSKFTAPHYYLNVEFDMDQAIAFRKQVNAIPDTKISFNDMIVKACAMALKKHPQVNSQWFDDRMQLNHHVHIGVAVAVPDGLVVPVVKFTDSLSLTQIGALVKDYAVRARDKKLALNEMEGSTFTISNLGMFGIESFTSIINQPNSAILSVGSIVQKPVVKDGEIVIGNTMKLTLACDHRTVDGATGAQFLQTLKTYIENPVAMFV